MNAKLFYLVLSVFIVSFLDSSAMICIKNGKGERYSTGFEPCRYYWDNVINNDGTAYTGPWGAIPPCWDKPRTDGIAHVAGSQLNRTQLEAIMKNVNEKAILNCTIAAKETKGSGYLVKINSDCVGFYRDKSAFLKSQETAKGK